MGSNVESVKDRLDIVEVLTPYLKLEKAGANFKARCPFHNEKTPSFVISPSRQSYYCFGCGAKGDMFTFIQEVEGIDFREALKLLADKAGVELKESSRENKIEKTEKEQLLSILEEATSFFEKELVNDKAALDYLKGRNISAASIKEWRIGYAVNDWRVLYSHLTSLGYKKELIVKAGLAKYAEGRPDKDPYDVFRGRIIFPLFDHAGKVVAFSGRALLADTVPKYLNSPETVLFSKSELLYGLDKAKEDIRRKDYAVLVEGQIDLVLSHQSGVKNVVASSGTAFTPTHFERLRRLSKRIVLAFDGDKAGQAAAERSAMLGLSLAMEVKVAALPEDRDPADLISENTQLWKDVLRDSRHAVEYFLIQVLESEKDPRKRGKLIEKRILPLIMLLTSSIERSHFVSFVAKNTGIREEMIWEDLRKIKVPQISEVSVPKESVQSSVKQKIERLPRKSYIERRLIGIIFWQSSLPQGSQPIIDVSSLAGEIIKRVGQEYFDKLKESLEIEREVLVFEAESYYADPEKLSGDIVELLDNLSDDLLREELGLQIGNLSRAEAVKDDELIRHLTEEIQELYVRIRALEEKRKIR
jgi:DNA primase